jgi:hypothetical protein
MQGICAACKLGKVMLLLLLLLAAYASTEAWRGDCLRKM